MINNYFDIPTPDGHDNLWKFNNQRKYYQDAMCDYSQQSTQMEQRENKYIAINEKTEEA